MVTPCCFETIPAVLLAVSERMDEGGDISVVSDGPVLRMTRIKCFNKLIYFHLQSSQTPWSQNPRKWARERGKKVYQLSPV